MAAVPGALAVKSFLLSAIFFSLLLCPTTAVPRRLAALVKEPPLVLQHHGGALLKGSVTVNLVWYGRFSPSQRAIVVDFLLSLGDTRRPLPSVASWWATTAAYGRGGKTQISLGKQILDEGCSLGKSLKSVDLVKLAGKIAGGGAAVNVVLTANDVAVEGFCMSRCGTHGVWRDKAPFVWVGNSVSQCPGQCAWPFHQPVYGPQTPPLVAPNGDVGVDGMVINLAGLLAGTVTNPFGDGYFQGPKGAGLEAASACAGIFGAGAYPGYPGKTLLDGAGGGSYNANGLGGRRYLLPALWDPRSSRCSTVV